MKWIEGPFATSVARPNRQWFQKHQKKNIISLTKVRPMMRLFDMPLSITAQLITLELLKRTRTQKVKTRFSGHTRKLNSGLPAEEATYSKTVPILASKSLNNVWIAHDQWFWQMLGGQWCKREGDGFNNYFLVTKRGGLMGINSFSLQGIHH